MKKIYADGEWVGIFLEGDFMWLKNVDNFDAYSVTKNS